MIAIAALLLALLSTCSAYVLSARAPLRPALRARQTPQGENDLQRELEVFFELANNQV